MSLRKVLLVKPSGRHGLSFAFDLIPTGLEYLAAAIEPAVREVAILDLEMERRPSEEALNRCLDALDPDAVGITMSATDHDAGLAIARMAKARGAMTILGGYHPTTIPEELLSCPEVDVVVRGEGERTLQELMVRGRPKGVRGTSYKEGGEIVHNGDRELIEDLDQLAFPARHLRRYRYRTKVMREREHDALTTSRGCVGQCTFCCEPGMNRGRQRYRSPQNVMDEILEIVSYHHGRPISLEVTDPNFLGRPERVESLCDLLAFHDLDIRFGIKARADAVAMHPDLVRKMVAVGFEGFEMGIESPDRGDIQSISKGLSADVHAQAVRNIKAAGGNAGGTFVIGLPHHTEEQILTFPAYAKKIGLTSAAFGIATPFPGTAFYRELESRGAITETDWGRYDEMHSVFAAEHLSGPRIEELSLICMARYWTVDTFLEKERMRVVRRGAKRSLGAFVSEKLHELGFSVEMGSDLQGRAMGEHARQIVAASADPGVEKYTRDVRINEIVEMGAFLRLLGSQTVQLTVRSGGADVTSWVLKTSPQGVEEIRVTPGRTDLATIDLAVDLDDFRIGSGEDLGPGDAIRILGKMMAPNRGLRGRWNLARLLVAGAWEIAGYVGGSTVSGAARAFNGAKRPARTGPRRTPERRRSRRLSY